jgi:hypothetical protein
VSLRCRIARVEQRMAAQWDSEALRAALVEARKLMAATIPDRPGHWGDDGVYVPDEPIES